MVISPGKDYYFTYFYSIRLKTNIGSKVSAIEDGWDH